MLIKQHERRKDLIKHAIVILLIKVIEDKRKSAGFNIHTETENNEHDGISSRINTIKHSLVCHAQI